MSRPDEPSDLTAREARRRLGEGRLAATDLVASCLRRVDSLNPVVNAIVTRADERAMEEAAAADEALDRGEIPGPLHGLPVAIKDLQPTEGIRTTYGSHVHAENIPNADTGIVARIRQAGGIVIGKTNIPEFSIGANTVNRLFGATGNPFDVDKTCGGSSGGSAVAVATNMAPLATGSDHGGSLRIPACYSGVVGFRATPGVVPHDLRTMTQTFYSVQGPMARDVQDLALLLSVIAGRHPGDPMSVPLDASSFASLDHVDPASLRVGISADLGGVLVSESIRATFADRVERIGRSVGSVDELPVDLRPAADIDWRLRSDVFATQYALEADGWDDDFNPNIRATYNTALETPVGDIALARRGQMELYHHFRSIFEGPDACDVLICPGVSISPFPWADLNPTSIDGSPVENYMAWLALTSSLTVVGHPVVAVPCGLDAAGMPFGVQVVGPMFSDHRLLSIASALEAAWANDAALARPRPDLDALANTPSTCRTEGRLVQERAIRKRD